MQGVPLLISYHASFCQKQISKSESSPLHSKQNKTKQITPVLSSVEVKLAPGWKICCETSYSDLEP